MLGLAFKPNTDDMRDAPSIDIANKLIAAGASVRGYDPVSMEVAAPMLSAVDMYDDPYSMAKDCDALIVNTEWNEFKQLNRRQLLEVMKQPVIFDGRNIYDPEEMTKLGFKYRGVGRGYNGTRKIEE